MEITGTTKLYGLFGSPVEHSMSPAMYNYCFQKFNLDGRYLAFTVTAEQMQEAISAFRTLGMKGANITMPCKQAVIPFLDQVSPAVELAGACNTIVEEEGVLKGYITDGEGYVMNLGMHGIDIHGKKITLLGAGGAATAIQVQALLDGAEEIAVFNKKDTFWEAAQKKIGQLQDRFPDQKINLYDLDDQQMLGEKICGSDILTNATKVGMKPMEGNSLIKDLSLFHKDLMVTDCVYHPRETRLLADAKACGCRTADGVGMLLYQGAAAWKLYTGLEMPVEEIREKFYQTND